MNSLSLTNKKYLVIGASSGIGRQAAIQISQLGGSVVLTGRNENNLKETLSQMQGEGHIIMPYDLSDLENIKDFVKGCISADNKKFDGMVFSAGISWLRPLRTETAESMEIMFRISFLSYIMLLKEFSSKRVLNDNGSIVALSSRAALFPEKGYMSYSTAKASVNVASIVASREFVSRKIRVNTICPEATKTPMTQLFFNAVDENSLKKLYPLDPLTVEDVANTIVFLLSDMSKKITGQNLYLSAGNEGTPIDGYIV